MMLLNEMPHLGPQNGLHRPIRWYNNKPAYHIDFHVEYLRKAMQGISPQLQSFNFDWIAKHPVDDLYIVSARSLHDPITHATPDEVKTMVKEGVLSDKFMQFPNGWWQWAYATDRDGQPVAQSFGQSAAKRANDQGFGSRLNKSLEAVS